MPSTTGGTASFNDSAGKASEARFRAFVSATSDIVYQMSADWSEMRFLQGRKFVADTSGPRRSWLERYIPQEDQPAVLAAIADAIAKRSAFQLEHRVRRVDDSFGWVFSRAIPLMDADGQIVEWFGAANDVTERHVAEQRLLESEERFRTLFESVPVAVFVCDQHQQIKHYNRRAAELLGRYPLPAEQRDSIQLSLPDGTRLSPDQTPVAEVLHSGCPILNVELAIERPDSSLLPIIVNFAPVRGRSGSVDTVVVSFFDISERKSNERRLASLARERERLLAAERAARGDAEAANHLKDDFLATVSHELRTPLSTVVSWGRLLQQKFAHGEELLQRGLTIIVNNAKLQAQILSDLLDMSRIVSGKIQLESTPCDLGQLITGAVESQRPAAEAKQLHLDVEPFGEPVIADIDTTRLQQVIWNLLSNAIKFTPQGGRVSVSMQQEGANWATIQVSDTGVGIPASFVAHVFDRFRQAESRMARRFGGLGLGLAIVKELVELHGGSVRAESPGEGRGATFTVRLPLRHADSEAGDDSREAARPQPAGPILEGLRILAVEDQPAALELLSRVLSEHGAAVTGVASAAAALDALRSWQRFDLLLSDIGLPEVDGFDLIRAVRATWSAETLPAIAVTAFTREEDRTVAGTAGFQAYVVKPYEVGKLLGLARSLARGGGKAAP